MLPSNLLARPRHTQVRHCRYWRAVVRARNWKRERPSLRKAQLGGKNKFGSSWSDEYSFDYNQEREACKKLCGRKQFSSFWKIVEFQAHLWASEFLASFIKVVFYFKLPDFACIIERFTLSSYIWLYIWLYICLFPVTSLRSSPKDFLVKREGFANFESPLTPHKHHLIQSIVLIKWPSRIVVRLSLCLIFRLKCNLRT